MFTRDILLKPIEPWIIRLDGELGKMQTEIEVFLMHKTGIRLIQLNGSAMRNWSDLYDEVTREFRLPSYFGRNLNALDECLTDLEWLKAKAFVILIRASEQILESEHAKDREAFFEVIRHAAKEWSRPVANGEMWDRSPVPFHALLHFSPNVPIQHFPPLSI